MNWSTFSFTGVTSQVTSLLIVVVPIAIGIFAITLAIKWGRRTLNSYSVVQGAPTYKSEYQLMKEDRIQWSDYADRAYPVPDGKGGTKMMK